jgi:hypothetical protein
LFGQRVLAHHRRSGAGKSSVARGVGQRLSRAAVIDGDFVNGRIVAGRVWALGEPAGEAARQVQLCNQNVCSLAANFADADITPVINWIIPNRAQLDFFLRILSPRRVCLVVLAPPSEVCRRRNAERAPEDQFSFDGHETLLSEMRRGFGDVGWWLDTSSMTLADTINLILVDVATHNAQPGAHITNCCVRSSAQCASSGMTVRN